MHAEGACGCNHPGGGPRVREGRRESVPRFGRCFIGMRARTGCPTSHTVIIHTFHKTQVRRRVRAKRGQSDEKPDCCDFRVSEDLERGPWCDAHGPCWFVTFLIHVSVSRSLVCDGPKQALPTRNERPRTLLFVNRLKRENPKHCCKRLQQTPSVFITHLDRHPHRAIFDFLCTFEEYEL